MSLASTSVPDGKAISVKELWAVVASIRTLYEAEVAEYFSKFSYFKYLGSQTRAFLRAPPPFFFIVTILRQALIVPDLYKWDNISQEDTTVNT